MMTGESLLTGTPSFDACVALSSSEMTVPVDIFITAELSSGVISPLSLIDFTLLGTEIHGKK